MELIIFMFVICLIVCAPIKCYTDAQYKTKCLEVHGKLVQQNENWICKTEGE